jgi:hypothetical protein
MQQVELQGVCLVVLSFFRDAAAAAALADTVAAHGGVLGAAVCCAEDGGSPEDDWTTCDGDRDALLDRRASLLQARQSDWSAFTCSHIWHAGSSWVHRWTSSDGQTMFAIRECAWQRCSF